MGLYMDRPHAPVDIFKKRVPIGRPAVPYCTLCYRQTRIDAPLTATGSEWASWLEWVCTRGKRERKRERERDIGRGK